MSKDDEERLNVTVKSNTKDLFAFTKLLPSRKKRIERASSEGNYSISEVSILPHTD